MEDVFNLLEITFNKSALSDFRCYLQKNRAKIYILNSDYCLHDKNKPNDVVSLTITPYFEDFEKISKDIENIAKKDIKNTRNINKKFIEYMNKKELFHINFILKNISGIIRVDKDKEKSSVLESISLTIDMLNEWRRNTPQNEEYFLKIIKKLNILKQNMNRRSVNYKLYKDIIIVSFLAAYVTYLLSKEAGAETVVWFSDRDKIVDSYRGIAYDLFYINHHSFCYKSGIRSENTSLGLGVPDEGDNKKLWYDSQNRIPDYLCGTLSDWDENEN